MKKTLLQMVLTCFVLGVVFTANNAAVERGLAEAEMVAAVSDTQQQVRLPVIMYHSVLRAGWEICGQPGYHQRRPCMAQGAWI